MLTDYEKNHAQLSCEMFNAYKCKNIRKSQLSSGSDKHIMLFFLLTNVEMPTIRRLNAIMFYVHFLKKMSIIYHWN